jgi:transposase
MDIDQIIAEIEWLERTHAVPDTRPLSPTDLSAANRRHDEMQANSPWFRLWQRYGVWNRRIKVLQTVQGGLYRLVEFCRSHRFSRLAT